MVGQQVGERTIEELSAELGRIEPPAFPDSRAVPVDGAQDLHHQDWQAGGSPRRTVVIHREFYRTSTLAPDTLVVYEQEHEDTQTQQQQASVQMSSPHK